MSLASNIQSSAPIPPGSPMSSLGSVAPAGPAPTYIPPGSPGFYGQGTGTTSSGGGTGGVNSASGSPNGPSIIGTGMYQSPTTGINPNDFNNPNYQAGAYQQQAARYLGATTQPVNTAQAVGGNYNNYNTGTAGQLGLAQQYQQMAAGNGPSLATVTAQQQGAANLAASESMLGSARGAGNPAQAQLAARNAQTQGAQQVAANAVTGRTNEELGAMNAAGGLYGNVAGQGLTQAQAQQQLGEYNAGQANQVAMGNQANTLAANTNLLTNYSNQGLAQQQGAIQNEQLNVNQQNGTNKN